MEDRRYWFVIWSGPRDRPDNVAVFAHLGGTQVEELLRAVRNNDRIRYHWAEYGQDGSEVELRGWRAKQRAARLNGTGRY